MTMLSKLHSAKPPQGSRLGGANMYAHAFFTYDIQLFDIEIIVWAVEVVAHQSACFRGRGSIPLALMF